MEVHDVLQRLAEQARTRQAPHAFQRFQHARLRVFEDFRPRKADDVIALLLQIAFTLFIVRDLIFGFVPRVPVQLDDDLAAGNEKVHAIRYEYPLRVPVPLRSWVCPHPRRRSRWARVAAVEIWVWRGLDKS